MGSILSFLVGFGFFVDEQGIMVKKPQVSYEIYFPMIFDLNSSLCMIVLTDICILGVVKDKVSINWIIL